MTPTSRRVVLDCDPGHDDAMAILLAAASPSINLVAITTVAGNQTLERVTLNARRVCSVAGIFDVPIAAGSDRPLERAAIVAEDIHGASGLDGFDWPQPTVAVHPRHGVDLIIEMAEEAPLTIVAVGPLTNVAAALVRNPGIGARIERISIMGGAIGLGNRTPSAEFNIHADPEAADVVMSCGVPITMVPLEVTHLALAGSEIIERIRALDTPVAHMSVALMRFFAATYHSVFGFDAPAVHDPCAVAAVIDPALVPIRKVNVMIDTSYGISAGRTACDIYGVTGLEANVDLGVDLKVDAFWELMIDAIAAYGPAPDGTEGA